MSEPRAAIERVVRDYLEGMIHGNPSQIEAAMHPKCMQAGHFNGVYEFFDRAEFIAALQAEDPAPPGTPIDSEILSVDITGDVALVKLRDACFGTTFTDYLTLIRHEGRWQIVMKAFFDHANDG
jgi:hypothetical protein